MQQIDRSGYTPGGQHYYTYKSPEFELTSAPRRVSCDFKVAKSVGMVFPEIVLAGSGNMTVTKVGFELLPAAER